MAGCGETRDGRSDYTNFEMDLLDTRMPSQIGLTKKKGKDRDQCKHYFIKPSCFPITIVVIFIIMIILLPIISPDFYEEETPEWEKTGICRSECQVVLTESIPEGLAFKKGSFVGLQTFLAWSNLLHLAKTKIDLTAFYWTLRGKDVYEDPTDWQGEKIYELLASVGETKKIRIVQNLDNQSQLTDSSDLQNQDLAIVRSLNFTRWFGSGVQHAKLWTVDDTHLYIGSADMDWRSLTQSKELGIVVYNCTCLGREAKKVFDILWEMGSPNAQLPWKWHFKHATKFNASKPLQVLLNGTMSEVYIASSPPAFCPKGRNTDVSAIKHVVRSAQKFVYVAVTDYAAAYLFSKQKTFWPDIDNELKRAAFEKGVNVRLLINYWNHSSPYMFGYLNSLESFSSSCEKGKIEVKIFTVPSFNERQAKIPNARVNRNKYMVTDNTAYIGTSNWSGDYFNSTSGVSIVIKQNTAENSSASDVVTQLKSIFLRDWNSEYAQILTKRSDCEKRMNG